VIGNAWRHPSALPELDRLRDVAVASALLLLLLPLMLFVSIAIKVDSRGPLLRWELRTGPGGNRFRACRFRITVDEQSVRACREPALTFVGNLIHWLRIDVLPQLVNVLRGEMTCIPSDPQRPFFLE
jgi:lipopolysaccharide/colanic/teichoic acid biosynthesis glycosyltransferase